MKVKLFELILQDSLISQIHNGGLEWKKVKEIEEEDERIINIKPATNQQKWFMAGILGIIFFILASPIFFRFTNNISSSIGLPSTYNNKATLYGLFLHMFLFIVILKFLFA